MDKIQHTYMPPFLFGLLASNYTVLFYKILFILQKFILELSRQHRVLWPIPFARTLQCSLVNVDETHPVC